MNNNNTKLKRDLTPSVRVLAEYNNYAKLEHALMGAVILVKRNMWIYDNFNFLSNPLKCDDLLIVTKVLNTVNARVIVNNITRCAEYELRVDEIWKMYNEHDIMILNSL